MKNIFNTRILGALKSLRTNFHVLWSRFSITSGWLIVEQSQKSVMKFVTIRNRHLSLRLLNVHAMTTGQTLHNCDFLATASYDTWPDVPLDVTWKSVNQSNPPKCFFVNFVDLQIHFNYIVASCFVFLLLDLCQLLDTIHNYNSQLEIEDLLSSDSQNKTPTIVSHRFRPEYKWGPECGQMNVGLEREPSIKGRLGSWS